MNFFSRSDSKSFLNEFAANSRMLLQISGEQEFCVDKIQIHGKPHVPDDKPYVFPDANAIAAPTCKFCHGPTILACEISPLGPQPGCFVFSCRECDDVTFQVITPA
jgi:hypothetical protein